MEDDNIFTTPTAPAADYNDESIVHLEDMEHIRLRPGMYIGKLGDGSSHDDGIYVLIKEVIDNSIDEFTSGYGKKIEVKINFGERRVSIRDYGRGIPLGKLVEAVSKLNTGAKYDSKVFQKSVGLNGVGTKAVNALSSYFKVQSFREGKTRTAEFNDGKLVSDSGITAWAGAAMETGKLRFLPAYISPCTARCPWTESPAWISPRSPDSRTSFRIRMEGFRESIRCWIRARII